MTRRALLSSLALGLLLGTAFWVVDTGPPHSEAPTAEKTSSAFPDWMLPGAREGVPQRSLYRWRDEAGRLHITSEPPPSLTDVEVLALPAPPRREPKHTPVGDSNPARGPTDPISVYTPGGLKDLFEEVERVGRQMGEREAALRSLKEEL